MATPELPGLMVSRGDRGNGMGEVDMYTRSHCSMDMSWRLLGHDGARVVGNGVGVGNGSGVGDEVKGAGVEVNGKGKKEGKRGQWRDAFRPATGGEEWMGAGY